LEDNIEFRVNLSLIKISNINTSLKFTIEDTSSVEFLKDLKNKPLLFTIYKKEKIFFAGKIVSVAVQKKTHFVVHTEVNKELIIKLLNIKNILSNFVFVMLSVKEINKKRKKEAYESYDLGTLLEELSKKTGIEKEKLLIQLTSFERNGSFYKGKKDLESLSEKQKVIVFSKIKKMLKE